jgi:hypothetical protein
MTRRRICACQALLKADGTGPHGCHLHRKPHLREQSTQARARRRQHDAVRGLPTKREVNVAAARAMAKARPVRGVGGDASPAVLEDEVATVIE